jgi:diaminopimelate decarboxylase
MNDRGCLRVVGGHLWVEECDTVALAGRFGTPLYVMSEAQLRANCLALQGAFERCWGGPVQLLPSLKANYVLAVRALLNALGAGCDVFGANELQTALRAGVPAAHISVNGSAKSAAVLRAAVVAGATLTLDSAREMDDLCAITDETGLVARARLRVRPDYDRLTEHSDFFPDMAIRDAAQLYKPGIEPEAAREIGRRALSHGRIQLTGLMTHLGRHSADPIVWAKMAAGFGEVVASLAESWAPWKPAELDVGGGFPAPRDPTHPARWEAAPIDEYADAIATTLRTSLVSGGIDPGAIVLQIEPGRSLFADAGDACEDAGAPGGEYVGGSGYDRDVHAGFVDGARVFPAGVRVAGGCAGGGHRAHRRHLVQLRSDRARRRGAGRGGG